ncbi:MAG: hypothetical protein WAV00_17720 [Nocardioides sp.]
MQVGPLKIPTVIAISVAFVLTACSESSGFSSPEDVAKQLGCTNVGRTNQVDSASVTCTFHGDRVIVSWFDSEDQENGFKYALKQMPGADTKNPIVYGHRWAIWCTQAEACAAAKNAMS